MRLPIRPFHALDNEASKSRKFATIHAAIGEIYDAERQGDTTRLAALCEEFQKAGISLIRSDNGAWLWEQVA